MGRGHKRTKRSDPKDSEVLGTQSASAGQQQQKSEEEAALEAALFGTGHSNSAAQAKGKQTRDDAESDQEALDVADDQLFFLDAPAAAPAAQAEQQQQQQQQQQQEAAQDSDDEAEEAPLPASFASYSVPSRSKQKKSVWHDPADESLSVSLAGHHRLRKLRDSAAQDVVQADAYQQKLRQHFEKVNPAPQWAQAARLRKKRKAAAAAAGHTGDSDDDGDQVDEDGQAVSSAASKLLRKATKQVRSSARLPADKMDIERLADANQEVSSKSAVRSIGFHPTSPILFTVSSDRRLRLFKIDGKHNSLMQTVHVPELPLASAHFHPSGTSILLLGHAPFFLIYNLATGHIRKCKTDLPAGAPLLYRFSPDGSILAQAKLSTVRLLDWHAGCQVLSEIHVASGQIRDLCWFDAHVLATITSAAEVYVWDTRTGSCTARWMDQGGFGAQAFEATDKFVATSSNTGIVNVYSSEAAMRASASEEGGPPRERAPLKSLMNLTTGVDTLRFSPSSQVLVMASSEKQDALKLVHTPTMTVYSNWPTASTPLNKVTDVAFSSGSQYLAIGNSKGRVLLYRLNHFAR